MSNANKKTLRVASPNIPEYLQSTQKKVNIASPMPTEQAT
jgi:hypothetical protein